MVSPQADRPVVIGGQHQPTVGYRKTASSSGSWAEWLAGHPTAVIENTHVGHSTVLERQFDSVEAISAVRVCGEPHRLHWILARLGMLGPER